jgi:hypothetical protein
VHNQRVEKQHQRNRADLRRPSRESQAWFHPVEICFHQIFHLHAFKKSVRKLLCSRQSPRFLSPLPASPLFGELPTRFGPFSSMRKAKAPPVH